MFQSVKQTKVATMKTKFSVEKPRRPGPIKLRSALDDKTYGRQVSYTPGRNNRLPFRFMQPGDCVFMPGYTLGNYVDGLRKLNMTAYTKDNTRVWTTRSTVVKGVRGVRIFRVA
jgi:hypothetical protein